MKFFCKICNDKLRHCELSYYNCDSCNSYYDSVYEEIIFIGVNFNSHYIYIDDSMNKTVIVINHVYSIGSRKEIYFDKINFVSDKDRYDLIKSYIDNIIFE